MAVIVIANAWRCSISVLIITLMIISETKSNPTFLQKYCDSNNTSFAANSNYLANLDSLFNSLSTTAATDLTGFHTMSVGNDTKDAVFGLFLCRGDQNTSSCSDCVATGIRDQPRICTGGVIWYDECMLRYDNQSLSGRVYFEPSYELWDHNIKGNNETQLGEFLGNSLRDLAGEAANHTTGKKYATKVVNFTNSETYYMMEQCTPDLLPVDCFICLMKAMEGGVVAGQAGRVMRPSCIFRYDIHPFFNVYADLSSSSSPPISSPDAGKRTPMSDGSEGHKPKGASILTAMIISSITAILLLCGIIFLVRKWKVKRSSKDENEIITIDSLQYDISKIKSATNNFSADNKLGQGGFGDVFKGKLQSGLEIAVKRLSPKSKQGIQEFKTEVLLVAKLQHKNLVRLLGFCATEAEKLLVYEYLPRSSLDKLLFDRGEGILFVWDTRYKIIDGIARGLRYLHEDSRYKIVHRDLKPSNILLDKDMSPKISDFGLAKLFGEDQVQGVSKRIVGTHGYMAPEYMRTGQLSVKSDVYSFGVLVLEILSGQRIRNHLTYNPEHDEGLLQRAWRLWNEKEPLVFMDSKLCGNFPHEEATRCIYIGLLCVQDDVDKRPSMTSIVSLLKTYAQCSLRLTTEDYQSMGISISQGQLGQSTKTYSAMEGITALSGR